MPAAGLGAAKQLVRPVPEVPNDYMEQIRQFQQKDRAEVPFIGNVTYTSNSGSPSVSYKASAVANT